MSIYDPPREILPIFNPSDWQYGTDIILTQADADARYLKLTGGTERGSVTFNNNISVSGDTNLTSLNLSANVNANSLVYVDSINGRIGTNVSSPSYPIDIRSTTTTGHAIASFTSTNMSALNRNLIYFGRSLTNGNYGGLRFYYAGSGNTNNRIDMFVGPEVDKTSPEAISVYYTGNVHIANTAIVVVPSTSVNVNSDLNVSGNVAVDTNVLKVDTTGNNAVGINVSDPTCALDLDTNTSGATITIARFMCSNNNVNSQNTQFTLGTSDATYRHAYFRYRYYTSAVNSDLQVGFSGQEAAIVLKGRSLGVGKSPATTCELDVNGNTNIATGKTYRIANTAVLSGTSLGSGIVNSSLTSVGTLTSLICSGNVEIDTNVLFVDTTNNRVGINKTPTCELDVSGNTNISSGKTYRIDNTDVLSGTSLGTGIVSSSLTSLGTITDLSATNANVSANLKVSGYLNVGGTPSTNANAVMNFNNVTGEKICFFASAANSHYGMGVAGSSLNFNSNLGRFTFYDGGTSNDGTEVLQIENDALTLTQKIVLPSTLPTLTSSDLGYVESSTPSDFVYLPANGDSTIVTTISSLPIGVWILIGQVSVRSALASVTVSSLNLTIKEDTFTKSTFADNLDWSLTTTSDRSFNLTTTTSLSSSKDISLNLAVSSSGDDTTVRVSNTAISTYLKAIRIA